MELTRLLVPILTLTANGEMIQNFIKIARHFFGDGL